MCFYHDNNVSVPLNKIDYSHRKIIGYYNLQVFINDYVYKSDFKDYLNGHGTHTRYIN
jgi:hypothetical protein